MQIEDYFTERHRSFDFARTFGLATLAWQYHSNDRMIDERMVAKYSVNAINSIRNA
jgi:hypothetical protein